MIARKPKPKLFDVPSPLAQRIARGDETEATWQELTDETYGDRHLLKQRMRAGTATLAEQRLATDLLDILDSKKVRSRGRPTKLYDKLGREVAEKFLAVALAPRAQKAWDRMLHKERGTGLTKADIVAVITELGVHRSKMYQILKGLGPKVAKQFTRLPPGD